MTVQDLKPGSRGIPNLLSGFRLPDAPVMLYLASIGRPFSFAAIFRALEALEEIAITATISNRRSNIPSIRHARRELSAPPVGGEGTKRQEENE